MSLLIQIVLLLSIVITVIVSVYLALYSKKVYSLNIGFGGLGAILAHNILGFNAWTGLLVFFIVVNITTLVRNYLYHRSQKKLLSTN